jgi:hypothetical protein
MPTHLTIFHLHNVCSVQKKHGRSSGDHEQQTAKLPRKRSVPASSRLSTWCMRVCAITALRYSIITATRYSILTASGYLVMSAPIYSTRCSCVLLTTRCHAGNLFVLVPDKVYLTISHRRLHSRFYYLTQTLDPVSKRLEEMVFEIDSTPEARPSELKPEDIADRARGGRRGGVEGTGEDGEGGGEGKAAEVVGLVGRDEEMFWCGLRQYVAAMKEHHLLYANNLLYYDDSQPALRCRGSCSAIHVRVYLRHMW